MSEPTRPEKTQRTTTQSTILEERPPADPVRREVTPPHPPRRRWRWLRLVFRRPLLAALVAIAALVASYQFGGVLGGHHRVLDEGVAVGNAVVFLGSAVVAVRGATDDLLHRVPRRIGDARISALRLMCLFSGYVLIGIAALSLLRVPVAHLLLGGVLTGVILGIAAQQSLGNTFAGLVLLFARPFSVGSPVTIRSGALGGSITGTVTGMSLTYVTLRTERGTVLLPNTAVLASAIGPDAEWQG